MKQCWFLCISQFFLMLSDFWRKASSSSFFFASPFSLSPSFFCWSWRCWRYSYLLLLLSDIHLLLLQGVLCSAVSHCDLCFKTHLLWGFAWNTLKKTYWSKDVKQLIHISHCFFLFPRAKPLKKSFQILYYEFSLDQSVLVFVYVQIKWFFHGKVAVLQPWDICSYKIV